MRPVTIVATLILSSTCWVHPANAGGPLFIRNGAAIKWDTNTPIPYKVDQGSLGPLADPKPTSMVQEAFKTWSDVPTSHIEFSFAGHLDLDVKTDVEYVLFEDGAAENAVIFDTDGAIIAGLAGEGNRNRILGWANAVVKDDRLIHFYSLMNCSLVESAATFQSTLVHEFGHAIGLDHSQINASFVGDGDTQNDADVPTMYPTSTDDDTFLASLNPDDEASVSRLYPSASFSTRYGTITGRLVRPNSTPVLGANVIAGSIASFHDRFSCVSDYLMRGNGEFELAVLPGKYQLQIEPIRKEFTDGSSVGPYATTPSSKSFVNPVHSKLFSKIYQIKAGRVMNVGTLVAD